LKKTNAARILDSLKIFYELKEFSVDENDLSAENAAARLRVPVEQVFKTLVARGDRTGVLIACIPGGRELEQKALARVSGYKKVEMVPSGEITRLTGYIRGAVSPLGMKKNYPFYLEESAFRFSTILVSAGARGVQISLAPQDLAHALEAKAGPIARQP